MACQGPEPPTEEQVDYAMMLIMAMLKKEFGVLDPVVNPSYLVQDKDTGEFVRRGGSWITVAPMDEHWYEAKGKLRDAVREMLFAQACNDW